jgi:hypothetical protein
MPFGPWPGASGGTPTPLFRLQLAYGQGNGTTDEAISGDATTWWLAAQSTADDVIPASGSPQSREWVTRNALGFIGITVRVDAATINGEIGLPLIITVDGADTAVAVTVAAGSTVGETLQQYAAIPIPAGSSVGVRADATQIDPGSTLRCEVIVEGAISGTPTIPVELPADPLALYLPGDLSLDGTTWVDSVVGNEFSLGVPVLVGAAAPTRHAPDGSFNGNPYAVFAENIDGDTFQILSTAVEMFAPSSTTPILPRTCAAVIRPTGLRGGTVACVQRRADYCAFDLAKPGADQWAYDNSEFAQIAKLSTVTNYGGEEIVCIWRTDGAVIDLWINGLKVDLSTNAVGDDFTGSVGFALGNNETWVADGPGISTRGWRGAIAFCGMWGRRFTDAEVLSATGYLTQHYVTP